MKPKLKLKYLIWLIIILILIAGIIFIPDKTYSLWSGWRWNI